MLPEVEQLCDRAAVIVGGKVAFSGTAAELTARAKGGSLEAALTDLYKGTP